MRQLDEMTLEELILLLEEAQGRATKGPWSWWTSNSHWRLSSDPSGADGDVLHAYRASDGLSVVAVRENDARLIELAVNALPILIEALRNKMNDEVS